MEALVAELLSTGRLRSLGRFDMPVRRGDRMLDDAFDRLRSVDARQFRKQIRVIFDGEEGEDMGGVQREFFTIAARQLVQPERGLFVFNADLRTFFYSAAAAHRREYCLAGTLIGLAMYNNATVGIHFAPIVYRRLLGYTESTMDEQEYEVLKRYIAWTPKEHRATVTAVMEQRPQTPIILAEK